MSHEEQMATMRRKFAAQVALDEMSPHELSGATSAALARRFDIDAHWAGAAIRQEQRRRA